MIKKVHGDILLSDAQVIAHGVAPHDHFNQGLALALRERHPAMVKDFRHYCHQSNPKPGGIWLWAGPEKVIVNLMTQDPAPSNKSHPGKAKKQYVSHSLKALSSLLKEEGLKSVALPKLATGVGGMEWEIIEPIIDQYLGRSGIPVIVYETYIKGQKANENLK